MIGAPSFVRILPLPTVGVFPVLLQAVFVQQLGLHSRDARLHNAVLQRAAPVFI